MDRRRFVQAVGSTPAWLIAFDADAVMLKYGAIYSLRCLGHVKGPRYLDGRTHDGSVALVPDLVKPYSGTKWELVKAGEGLVAFKCRGHLEGARWLDGRTAEGKVGLAPHTRKPFSGTRWQITEVKGGVTLKCMGSVEGPRWLDGNTGAGTVALAPNTEPPFTGTRWELKFYPTCIDDPCNLP
jgi:hypothetical protein